MALRGPNVSLNYVIVLLAGGERAPLQAVELTARSLLTTLTTLSRTRRCCTRLSPSDIVSANRPRVSTSDDPVLVALERLSRGGRRDSSTSRWPSYRAHQQTFARALFCCRNSRGDTP